MSDHEDNIATQDLKEIEEPVATQDLKEIEDHDLFDEVDDADVEEYDPNNANIEDRPVTIDENVTRTLKAAKRKIPIEQQDPKLRDTRRDNKRSRDGDVEMTDVGDFDHPSKARNNGDRSHSIEANDSNLTPEERRKKDLSRLLDNVGKAPKKVRKKKDETDLEDPIDEQINELTVQIERACQADNDARQAGEPAIHKLRILPQVISMLNRNSAQAAVVDPDTNFLRAIRYFLEPLYDGRIPAYNIQREVFTSLMKLPIDKEALLSSGLGKVVYFYTKSRQPQLEIKRMAEKLIRDWSRPILRRTDDYRKRHIDTATFDHQIAKLAQRHEGAAFGFSQRNTLSQHELERQRALAIPDNSGRARITDRPVSYTVAPVSTFTGAPKSNGDHRPIGSSGIDAFRRMAAKAKRRNN